VLDDGKENIENLPHHNLMELIARTRIPTPRLVSMIDQATMYLHLGLVIDTEHEETNKNEKDDPRIILKWLGIRTVTDLINADMKSLNL